MMRLYKRIICCMSKESWNVRFLGHLRINKTSEPFVMVMRKNPSMFKNNLTMTSYNALSDYLNCVQVHDVKVGLLLYSLPHVLHSHFYLHAYIMQQH